MKTSRLFSFIVAATLAVFMSASSWAADWYVDSGVTGSETGGIMGVDASNGTAGSDSNAGTSAAPFLTLAKLQTVMATGDNAYLAGRFYTTTATSGTHAFALNDKHTLSFSQWPGRSPCVIRGDIKITSAWTDNGDGTFSATVTSGLTSLADVTYGWDQIAALTDPVTLEANTVRRFSHLTLVADNAAVIASVGTGTYTYFYTSGTGVIRVHLPFDVSPDDAGNLVTYVPKGRGGFTITQTSVNNTIAPSIHFSGMRFVNWSDASGATPAGTSIYIVDGSGCTISDCVFEDSGLHAISFGGYCKDNVLTRNTYIGMATGAVTVVFNATGTYSSVANTANGCRVIGDLFYANSLMNPIGVRSVVAGSVVTVVYSHGNHSDIECVNVRVVGMVPSSGTPDSFSAFASDDGATPSNPLNPETYAFRVRQTDPSILTVANGTFNTNLGITSSIAYIGTRLHYPQFGDISNGAAFDYTSNDGYVGFFGSENIVDMTRADGTRQSFYRLGAAGMLVLINTSTLDSSLTNSGGSNNTHHAFDYSGNSATKGTIKSYKSIYSFRATAAAGHNERRFINGDEASGSGGDIDVPAANMVFADNMIWNVTAAKYSGQAAYDTAAEFYPRLDPNGFELTMQPFADVTGATTLALRTTGTAWEAVQYVAPYALKGSDGWAFAGHYGCSQAPSQLIPAANRSSIFKR